MHASLRLQSPQFVALASNRVIGWSIAHRTEDAFARHCCTLFMGHLPGWRGLGIGRQLLQETIDNAWRGDCNRISLDVYANNLPAIRLYRQAGFVEEGLKRRAHCIDGEYRDVLSVRLAKTA
jgi:RimJ/RimL family protein N-acetyltransferase